MCTICTAFRPQDKECAYARLMPEEMSEGPPPMPYTTVPGGGSGSVTFAPTNGTGTEGSNGDGDAANGTTTAYYIGVNDTFDGTISQAGDRDWVAIDLTAGQIYGFEVTGRTGSALDDSFIRLRDSDGTVIALNDDGGSGFNALLHFQAQETGTYYIDVGGYVAPGTRSEWMTGGYTLTSSTLNPAKSLVSHDTLAAYLTDGYWQDNGGVGHAFDTSSDNIISVDIDGLNAAGQRLALWALQSFEMIIDVTFDVVGSNADITFDDEQSGAYASYSSVWNDPTTTDSAFINVSTTWIDNGDDDINDYGFQTYIHEIGHALGLGHQGDYNGSATFGLDNVGANNTNTFLNDSWLTSIMSYFDQNESTFAGSSTAALLSPMLIDLIALENLYGAADAGSSPTAGNTVFGAGHTFGNAFAGSDLNANGSYLAATFDYLETGVDPNGWFDTTAIAFTINDVGGTDLIDFSFDTTDQFISLEAETLSTVLNPYGSGHNDNMWIARGTVIENYTAGSGDDSITGNAAANEISGNAGNDTISGGEGFDTLSGGEGGDSLDGGLGADILNGNAGNDTLLGGANADTLVGGTGDDVLLGGLSTDILIGEAGADSMDGGEEDDIYYVETGDVVTDSGTAGFDKAQIVVTAGQNLDMSGWSGVERVEGYLGNDTIDGSALTEAILIWGHDGDDTISSGAGNDVLLGGEGNDVLSGGDGDDTILGQEGNDTLSGGIGNDVFYVGDDGDVVSDGGAGYDVVIVNNAAGINLSIGAWAAVERIEGFTGNDTIDASGYAESLVITGGMGGDSITGGSGADTVYADDGDDIIMGGDGDDALIGDGGNDTIEGGLGKDFLFGGDGLDTFVFDTGWGEDVIAGFTSGEDKMDMATIAGVDAIDDLSISGNGTHTFISLAIGGVDLITLANFNGVLTESDFNFV